MKNRKIKVVYGVNSAFMTRRYEKPENWMRIVSGLGFKYLSMDSDMVDPFFSGTPEYLESFAKNIAECAKRYGVEITDYFTGMASYRFFGLSHSHQEQRSRMLEWFKGAICLAAAMGANGMGGRCDAFSVEVLEDEKMLKERYDCTAAAYRSMADFAKAKGLSSIYFEQMYAPSLPPYTIEQTYEYIEAVNRGNTGVPVRPVVDVGHACGQNYGAQGGDLRYETWIESFGAACDVIHLQQTKRDSSSHLPFSRDVNGDIHMESILESLTKSAANYENEPWSEFLSPPERIVLTLETLPGTAQCEEEIFDGISQSGEYFGKYIPKEGIEIPY